MKNIRFIKNILIIVCLSFSILTSISKCNAYTFEQFEQFLNACSVNNITTNAMTTNDLTYAKNNLYKITNYINNNNVNISQYTSFAIRGSGRNNLASNDFMEVWFFNGQTYYQAQNRAGPYMDILTYIGGIYINTNGVMHNITTNNWYKDFKCGIFANNYPYNDSGYLNCLTQYRWNPNDHPLIPPFTFNPYGILTSGDWYYQKFSYTGNICLGTLGDNEFYQLDIKLYNPNMVKLGVISIVPDVRHY